MRAIVLHYLADSVEVIDIPETLPKEHGYIQTETIEEYLRDEYGFQLDEIHYMTTNEDSTPVFYNGNEECGTAI